MSAGATIAAIASPRGGGRRGVLRVSGPDAWSVVERVWCGSADPPQRESRGFRLGRFDDGIGQQPLLLLWMPGPRSFTREDVAEFHLPGSAPLLEAALERILSFGVRPAGPGEFTRRAFENGRIDLTRAEGILALVHARGEAERRSASALLFGGLAERIAPLREGLTALWSLAEASLDFDEADTGHVPAEELEAGANRLLNDLQEAKNWEARRVSASDQPRVVLVGAPNGGKSSLFNVLVQDAQALVSDHRGTTRDVLHGTWTVPGGLVRLYDTAGLDERASGVDATAQRFGKGARESADLQLWVVDSTRTTNPVNDEWMGELEHLTPDVRRILVLSKIDQVEHVPDVGSELSLERIVRLSARTMTGVEELGRAVAAVLFPAEVTEHEGTERLEREIGVRHRVALTRSAEVLQAGLDGWLSGLPLDLFAESLRDACDELDAISGQTTAEDLLDRIFASFCIGK